ncbi:Nif3-like dinuclear metal center hexameric protein [Clostridium sp. UBA3061]|uniref:Nif3-like dinuclear metal center hexameric protein n=1 Tax=Clostridium sp. UBA3061 TaxID=1946353 RepID=UPI00321699D2
MVKINEIINIMEGLAPLNLKESYDNVGFMVGDREREVTKVLVALDCTIKVIEEAKELGAQLILTHHPLLFIKPKTITTDSLQGKKLMKLIENGIALYSSHTNWDTVKGGLNDEFVKILGFQESKIIEISPSDPTAGVGRIVQLKEETTLEEIIKGIKDKLKIQNLRYSGELNKKVRTIALVNGSGEDYLQQAYDLGAELLITGDTTYHFVSDYEEMGLSVIDIGHFNSEWPLVISLSEKIKKVLEPRGVEIIMSNATRDPYNFI